MRLIETCEHGYYNRDWCPICYPTDIDSQSEQRKPQGLTEDDVRRIVREELDKWGLEHDKLVNNPWAGILDDD